MLTGMTEPATKETPTTMAHQPTTTADRHPTTPGTAKPTGRIRAAITNLIPSTDRPQTIQPTGTIAAEPTDHADRLRLIPPVAALGTAFVMQTTAVTDTVGGAINQTIQHSPIPTVAHLATYGTGYLPALLLGLAVASCAEGGAAYLMDLYDKHLMARDSVWLLRIAMCVYVGLSAGAIHWWASYRHLPVYTSWLLAGMSASALFLWSRGSRWRNRVAMREAGQLDPALPKLPAAAKFWHPIRALNTVRLVSWEPVATTDEARAVYEEWRATRRAAKTLKRSAKVADRPTATPTVVKTAVPTASRPEPRTAVAEKPTGRPTTDPTTRPVRLVHGPTAIADAAFLREQYGDDQSADQFPGRNELLRRHGGNAGKWSAALKAHADRADRTDDDLKEATG